jgi:four helix bundle protein
VQSFTELKVWQKGIGFVTQVYKVTEGFPKAETYGLISQIRRAAVSIPTNISEGHTRRNLKEYIQFLYISKGSASELKTLLTISLNLGYLSKRDWENLDSVLVEIDKMLTGLISRLKNKD